MRIKTPLTETERLDLRRHVHVFRCALADQGRVVVEVAVLLGCHTDEALDFLNSQESAVGLLGRAGVEIAPDEPGIDEEDLYIDRETWRLWVLMAGGVALVCVSIWWICGG